MKHHFVFSSLIIFILNVGVSRAENAGVTPSPSPQGSPVATVTATATPAPLSDGEKKKLLSEFKKALTAQKNSLAHQEKVTMREFYISQKSKQRKWREEKKNERKVFFDKHHSGPERRDYVQSYLKAKEAFDASIQNENAATRKTWADKAAALKIVQKEREAQFNDSLSKGIRPAITLWPLSN